MDPASDMSVPTGAARVLVVSHLYPTPAVPWQCPWLEEQVRALARFARMSVLCPSQTVDRVEARTDPGDVAITCIPTRTVLGTGRPGLIGSSVRYRAGLARYLAANREGVDLLHAHFGFPDAVIVEMAGSSRGIPVVITLHGDDAFHVAHMRGPVGASVRRALTRAARVVCVSAEMARAVAAAAPAASTVVIENGFDDDLFHLGTGPRRHSVVFVGRLEAIKNVDLLIRAFAQAEKPEGARLQIAGTGSLRETLERLAAECGVGDRVDFLGQLSRIDVADLMRSAHCVALPSSSEGWGMAAAEALACGTPVVASRVGGIPEIAAADGAGILLPPGDIPALADALSQALAREWDPTAVAAASGARPWSTQAEKIAAVYSEVLRRPFPARGPA